MNYVAEHVEIVPYNGINSSVVTDIAVFHMRSSL